MQSLVRRLLERNRPLGGTGPFSGREARARARNPQLINHLTTAGLKMRSRYEIDRAERRRQAVASVIAWVCAAAFAWFVVESARALQIF